MAQRRLSPDEQRVWRQLAATVRPVAGRGALPIPVVADSGPHLSVKAPSRRAAPIAPPAGTAPPRATANTLDRSWDKRLASGQAAPDWTIDLHGHTLASAHALLDRALGDAIRQGARLVLLITGRPAADNPRLPPTSRGVIRASVEDWIAHGPHARSIAAIRNAHVRHGGRGALYLVLRRGRPT